MKFNFKSIAATVALGATLVGCNSEKKEEVKSESKAPQRVAYVINGALGDQSFYDSGKAGIDRIQEEFKAKTITIENNFDAAKYPQSLESAVRWKPDVIFVISFGYEDLVRDYADKNPNIKFVNIDTVVENSKKTITSIDFSEQQGSFMAGAAAALMTTDSSIKGIDASNKIVGTVSGMNDVVVNMFLDGFAQGAKHIDPEMEHKNIYVGSWIDPVKGKQAAKQLYSQGADVIYQVAGLTGSGVLEAAKEEGKYAIGVDSNQNGIQPGHVATSMLKNVGSMIYQTYTSIVDGSYEQGVVIRGDLSNDGVGLAIDEHSKAILPEGTLKKLEEVKKKIISGEIKVQEK